MKLLSAALLCLIAAVSLAEMGTALPVPSGQNVWTSNGPYGGSIYTLAIDPSNSQTVYAGTPGGVFKSTNGGSSWTAATSGLTNNVRTLAIDPSNSQTVYAGTPGGVFKSTNGGSSWTAATSGLTNNVRTLAIDPSNSQTIYAGTAGLSPGYGGGVFKSTNGGSSWTAVNSGLTNTGVLALAIDPSNSQTVYVGMDGGVFKSVNGGNSWTAVNSGLTRIPVNSFAVDPANPQTIYAGTADRGVFKSADGGNSWTAINSGLTNTSIYALAIDPKSPQTIYAGTLYNATNKGGVFKSTNGGSSWTAVNSGTSIYSLAIDPANPQTVYAGAGGGRSTTWMFKSRDGGSSWTDINPGLTSSSVYALAIDPASPQTVYAGTDGGVFVISQVPSVPVISVSDILLKFDSTRVGATTKKTLIISNTGSSALAITDITVRGTDASLFTVSASTATIESGQTQAVSVTFAPTSVGAKSASLSITHNATGSPATVALSGTGVPVSPPSTVSGPLSPKAGDGTGTLGVTDQTTRTLGSVKSGQKVDILISLSQEVAGATGFLVTLTFDPKKLSVVSGKVDGVFASAITPSAQSNSGTVTYGGVFPGQSVTAKGPVAVVTFLVANNFSGDVEVMLTGLTIRVGSTVRDFKPGASVVLSSGAGAGLAADFDGSGSVDFDDFFAFAAAFGKKQGETGFDARFDLSKNGEVDFDDFFIFAAEFGKTTKSGKAAASRPGVNDRASLSVGTVASDDGLAARIGVSNVAQMRGFSLVASYDPSALTFVKAERGTDALLSRGGPTPLFLAREMEPGRVVLADVISGGGTVSGEGALANLIFRRIGKEGAGTVSVDLAQVFDGSGGMNLPDTTVKDMPLTYELSQNTPNPFNPATTIRYALPEGANVSLVVYNILGQQVKTLVSGLQGPGYHTVVWDGRDEVGRTVSSGVYLYRLEGEGFAQTRRMLLLK